AHIAGNEAGGIEGFGRGVFNGSDIAGLDAQLTLDIKQRFPHGGALATHQIAEAQIERVKAAWLRLSCCVASRKPTQNHASCPSFIAKPGPNVPIRSRSLF